jgi:hypothetical protein
VIYDDFKSFAYKFVDQKWGKHWSDWWSFKEAILMVFLIFQFYYLKKKEYISKIFISYNL